MATTVNSDDAEADAKPSHVPLLFVEAGIGTKQPSKQARAHVARVNRQRQKNEKQRAVKTAAQRIARDVSFRLAASTPSVKQSNHFHHNGAHLAGSSSSAQHTALVAHSESTLRPCDRDPTVPRTLAPVFGALAVNVFDTKYSVEVAEVADFCFNVVMNHFLSPHQKTDWVAAFFSHPVVFHCLCYCCGVMKDVTGDQPIQNRRLQHKLRTIQLVNEQLDDLDNVDLEPIMLAIITLWRINTDEIVSSKPSTLLFSPHMRSANWIALFGKLGGDGVHAAALEQLVIRAGGLRHFKTLPSLQEHLAFADVLDSSFNATKPRFPKIWDGDLFYHMLEPSLEILSDHVEGRGFANTVPGGLPADMLQVLQRLAVVDKLLHDFATREPSKSEDFYLAALSNVVQHDLLSLTPWQKLANREGSFLLTYEMCRISATLYSNSVIFPMASSSAWLDKLLGQLRLVIETSDMVMWSRVALPLVMWSLSIGGIAAFWTGHRAFFLDQLRGTLQLHGMLELHEITPMLREFLWCEAACAHGAATIWEFFDMRE